MKKIATGPVSDFRSFNTCVHNGRILNFSASGRKLIVTEVTLGETLCFRRLTKRLACRVESGTFVSCCPLGEKILLMAGNENELTTALVEPVSKTPGRLRLRMTRLAVEYYIPWVGQTYLCPVSADRALMTCFGQSSISLCVLQARTLMFERFGPRTPDPLGFDSLPVPLPDGNLIATSPRFLSTGITRIFVNGEPGFEIVGSVPEPIMTMTSIVLVAGRFLVGFWGHQRTLPQNMWVFDSQSRKPSLIRQKVEAHPGSHMLFLAAIGAGIYLFGAKDSERISFISFANLGRRILDNAVRRKFCGALGLPFSVGPAYSPTARAMVTWL